MLNIISKVILLVGTMSWVVIGSLLLFAATCALILEGRPELAANLGMGFLVWTSAGFFIRNYHDIIG